MRARPPARAHRVVESRRRPRGLEHDVAIARCIVPGPRPSVSAALALRVVPGDDRDVGAEVPGDRSRSASRSCPRRSHRRASPARRRPRLHACSATASGSTIDASFGPMPARQPDHARLGHHDLVGHAAVGEHPEHRRGRVAAQLGATGAGTARTRRTARTDGPPLRCRRRARPRFRGPACPQPVRCGPSRDRNRRSPRRARAPACPRPSGAGTSTTRIPSSVFRTARTGRILRTASLRPVLAAQEERNADVGLDSG